MQSVALGFTAIMVMGLVFGAGPCNVACMPYLGPVFFGRARPWLHVASFSAGRIFGYVIIAAVAGALGHAATAVLEGRTAAVVLGTAAIGAGALVFFRRRPACGGRSAINSPRLMPVALFAMGAGMAFNPCTPLATVLLAAAASASPWMGGWLGFGFGLGAVVVPALLFGFLMARFGLEIRTQVGRWRGPLERGAGLLLITLGLFTLTGWVHP